MKVALVCTQGGHLTETLQLLGAFKGHQIFFVTHHSSRDEDLNAIATTYLTVSIEAHPMRLLYAFIEALPILFREKPDVILSLGAEIAIPFFFWGKLLGMKLIYLESWCRVSNLSRTAKIVYPIVDEFWVQWPELLEVCGPKAKFHGAVI